MDTNDLPVPGQICFEENLDNGFEVPARRQNHTKAFLPFPGPTARRDIGAPRGRLPPLGLPKLAGGLTGKM